MAVHDNYYTNRFRAVSGFYKEADAAGQANFVEDVLPLAPGACILDLACGYGRHAIELARRGYKVTGYDASKDYIEAAVNAAEEAGITVSFEHADMRQLNAGGRFDAVLSLSTSLAFYDEKTNLDILSRIHAAIKPGGAFLFDQGNIFWLVDSFVRDNADVTTNLADGRVHHRNTSFDPQTFILSRRSVLEGDDGRNEAGWDIRYYTLPELRGMFADIGFTLKAVYGDYDKSDYGLDSKRLITVAHAADRIALTGARRCPRQLAGPGSRRRRTSS